MQPSPPAQLKRNATSCLSTARMYVCMYVYSFHITPLNLVSFTCPLMMISVSCTSSWSGKKLLRAPCCCVCLYQLYTSTSIIHQYISSSSVSQTFCLTKWTTQYDTAITVLQTLGFLNSSFLFLFFPIRGINKLFVLLSDLLSNN